MSDTGVTSLNDGQRLLEEERKSEDSPHTRLNDFRSHIQLLYSSLAHHCICGSSNERKPILAKLGLNCRDGLIEAQLEDPSVNFSLLFLSHPHNIISAEIHQSQWRDTQICVYRKRYVYVAYQMKSPLKKADFEQTEQSALDSGGTRSHRNPFR